MDCSTATIEVFPIFFSVRLQSYIVSGTQASCSPAVTRTALPASQAFTSKSSRRHHRFTRRCRNPKTQYQSTHAPHLYLPQYPFDQDFPSYTQYPIATSKVQTCRSSSAESPNSHQSKRLRRQRLKSTWCLICTAGSYPHFHVNRVLTIVVHEFPLIFAPNLRLLTYLSPTYLPTRITY